MRPVRTIAVLVAAGLVLTACTDDDPTSTPTESETTSAPTETASETEPGPTATPTPSASEPASESAAPSEPTALEQPAIWPDAGTVFATPEAAAKDFVTTALGVPASLGEFQQGDARSGEIAVFFPGEGDGATPVQRGLLLLRQLGPDNGWFVTAAPHDVVTIDSPDQGATLAAGDVTVEGVARGFEGNVVVTAFVAGDADEVLDQEVTIAGAFETPEPYSVTLDLSGATAGDTVTILVRGGTGHEADPGEFAALATTIEE